MYPHERSLVKRLKDVPFALVGINSDKDLAELKKALEKENITWPSFWNGGSTSGPISKRWNVRSWPTIYILDAKGVIRFKNKRGKAMDEAVDSLLKEMGVAVPAAAPESKPTEE
jgi:Thioredoxin-like